MTTPGKINVESANDGEIEDVNGEQLQTALDGSEYALLTYIARALVSEGHDELRVAVQSDSAGTKVVSIEGDDDDGNTISINAETLSQAIADPNGLITYLARALQTQGSVDQVRVDLENNNAGTIAVEQQTPVGVENSSGTQIDPLAAGDQPLDVSGATVTVTDDGAFIIDAANQGTLPVEQQTPVDLEATDPITAQDSGTGSANAAELDLGPLRKDVDIHVNTSGDATLTVEVSTDASTWREFDTVSYTGGDVRMEQYEIAYQHVRAYLNQNRTLVELASKGTD